MQIHFHNNRFITVLFFISDLKISLEMSMTFEVIKFVVHGIHLYHIIISYLMGFDEIFILFSMDYLDLHIMHNNNMHRCQ